jgi:hypothetical protein
MYLACASGHLFPVERHFWKGSIVRISWLAGELRAAGLRVVEVDGWKTRGSAEFDPEGVTWHATAGSRTATAQGEVNVILEGSTSAPPPIAQLMIWRDGTVFVCAAGRCFHNKVGWAGPNKGLGNTRLLGIEMANDNRGEPWPDVQLDAARVATAAIMRRLGADPMRRLAAHFEHQPHEGRPPGETSTKTDPRGVDMTKERPRVAALMKEDDMPSPEDYARAVWTFDADNVTPGTQTAGGLLLTENRRSAATTNAQIPALAAAVAQLTGQVRALTSKSLVDERATAATVLAAFTPEQAAAIPEATARRVLELLTARLTT